MTCRTTIGASSILGFISDNHLTADEFNLLGSAFYIGELYGDPCIIKRLLMDV